MAFNRKGITPVVATSLLLVVTVLGVVSFQSWFNSFSSDLFVGVEEDSNINNFNLGFEGLIGSLLYINFGDNLTVLKVEIEGNDCLINGTYSGIQYFDASSCLSDVSTSIPEVVIYSKDKIFESSFYFEGLTYESCFDIDSGLLGYWDFDNYSGSSNGDTLFDESGNGYHGTIQNGITFSSSSGVVGEYGSFNGSGEFVSVSDNFDLSGGVGKNFTFLTWAKFNILVNNSPLSEFPLITKFQNSLNKDYGLSYEVPGNFEFYSENGGSNDNEVFYDFNDAIDTWYFFGATFNGIDRNITLYINGNLVNSSFGNYDLLDTSFPLEFASNGYLGDYLNGSLDEIMIYDRVLSRGEINTIYGSNLNGFGLCN